MPHRADAAASAVSTRAVEGPATAAGCGPARRGAERGPHGAQGPAPPGAPSYPRPGPALRSRRRPWEQPPPPHHQPLAPPALRELRRPGAAAGSSPAWTPYWILPLPSAPPTRPLQTQRRRRRVTWAAARAPRMRRGEQSPTCLELHQALSSEEPGLALPYCAVCKERAAEHVGPSPGGRRAAAPSSRLVQGGGWLCMAWAVLIWLQATANR